MPAATMVSKTAGQIVVIAVLIMMSGPALILCQCGLWLRYGEWPDCSVGVTWALLGGQFPETRWIGAQYLIAYFFGLPTSVVLSVVGFAALCLAIGLETSVSHNRR